MYMGTFTCTNVCATVWIPGVSSGQKRALNPQEADGPESTRMCWVPALSPL